MRKFKIVMVEDNPDHAELAADCLCFDAPGTQIQHFGDGAKALDYLLNCVDKSAALPDLILLDLNIPGLHGFDVLKTIKQNAALSAIPVVIVSTSSVPKDIRQSLQLHANSYTSKSMDFDLWESNLRSIRDYWRDVDQAHDITDSPVVSA